MASETGNRALEASAHVVSGTWTRPELQLEQVSSSHMLPSPWKLPPPAMQSPKTPAIWGTPAAESSLFFLKMWPAPVRPGKERDCSGRNRPEQSTR